MVALAAKCWLLLSNVNSAVQTEYQLGCKSHRQPGLGRLLLSGKSTGFSKSESCQLSIQSSLHAEHALLSGQAKPCIQSNFKCCRGAGEVSYVSLITEQDTHACLLDHGVTKVSQPWVQCTAMHVLSYR